MSFPNPDNYARDCDCGTAGANTTPPPATIQAEIDSLDTRVTVLEETNDVIVSSGGIADLTTAQQALIREGSIVVTTDGKRWVYSGVGSKVLEASYIQLSDVTIVSTDITDSTTAGRALLTAATVQAQRTALDIFLSYANLAAFPVSGNLQRLYLALDTQKTYVWNGSAYTEVSPNTHTRAGTANINVGETALSSASLSGANNTGVGASALSSNTTGDNNTATGFEALRDNTTGSNNAATGYRALLLNTTGANNTASGYQALISNTTGSNNAATGHRALFSNTTGGSNTASGVNALLLNTTADNNTASGTNALQANTTGFSNTATGVNALFFNETGANNTASGVNALLSNTTGDNNTASGTNALQANTTGASNVALGTQAGDTITTGSNNICIGSGSDVNAGTRANCISIGSGAVAQVDGEIAFASTLATKTTIGANGGATALTALPVGYIRIRIGATAYQIPYYNV
jgi:hypothetical protein